MCLDFDPYICYRFNNIYCYSAIFTILLQLFNYTSAMRFKNTHIHLCPKQDSQPQLVDAAQSTSPNGNQGRLFFIVFYT